MGVFRWSHMVSASRSGWLMGVSPQHKSRGPAEWCPWMHEDKEGEKELWLCHKRAVGEGPLVTSQKKGQKSLAGLSPQCTPPPDRKHQLIIHRPDRRGCACICVHISKLRLSSRVHMLLAPIEKPNISTTLMDEVLYACACDDLFHEVA